MNLYNDKGGWSDELIAACKNSDGSWKMPPNQHPAVLALAVAPYVPAPPPAAPVLPTIDAAAPVPDVPPAVTPSTVT